MRAALAALALTAGSAVACPTTPGFVANGLIRTPPGLAPTCGPLYLTFRQRLNTAKWTEMYVLPPDDTAHARVQALLAAITTARYTRVKAQTGPRSEVYAYARQGHTITVLVGISGALRGAGRAVAAGAGVTPPGQGRCRRPLARSQRAGMPAATSWSRFPPCPANR